MAVDFAPGRLGTGSSPGSTGEFTPAVSFASAAPAALGLRLGEKEESEIAPLVEPRRFLLEEVFKGSGGPGFACDGTVFEIIK